MKSSQVRYIEVRSTNRSQKSNGVPSSLKSSLVRVYIFMSQVLVRVSNEVKFDILKSGLQTVVKSLMVYHQV
jgi:hypothetical protein